MPVFAVGSTHVLKIFPPGETRYWEIETSALTAVEGRLPIETPKVDATGTIDGSSYVLMSQLAGRPMFDVWDQITPDERPALMRCVGETIRALHALDVTTHTAAQFDWDAFIEAQRAGCRERQSQHGLSSPWLEQIEAFLAVPTSPKRAILHTEIMREHLLVERRGTAWSISGLVDFEPSMVGDPEYDFASVGVFVSGDDSKSWRHIIEAYDPGLLADPDFPRRVMQYALLHRYSKLRWYLERVPPRDGVERLEDLAGQWFGGE